MKADAVLGGAPVFVVTDICKGGQELVKKVAVGTVDLDAVKSRIGRASGRSRLY